MRTKGFVLVMCLLFGLLCSALALAALTLTALSAQFNQAILWQKQRPATVQLPQAAAGIPPDLLPVPCPPQFNLWPLAWQSCQLRRSDNNDLNSDSYAGVIVTWQIDPQTQGGEL